MNEPIYLNPLTDYGFKKYFKDKACLISLLNALFRGEKHIVDLSYQSTEQVGEAESLGTVIFDLKVKTDLGEEVLIEVQTTRQSYLKKRMLYYACKTIADQAPKGSRANWGYAITEVYVIVLMDGFSMPDGSNGEVLHDIFLCNRGSGEIFYKGLGFIYVELINFDKAEGAIDNDLDSWLYVLNNISKLKKMPRLLKSAVFKRFFQIGEYSKLNKEERHMYDISLKNKWDLEALRQTQIMDRAEYESGLNALKKEVEKAMVEGRQEGRQEGKYEFVKNLICQFDFTDADAAQAANVSLAFVEKVRAELNNTNS